MMQTFLLLDANSLIFRAFFAMPQTFKVKDGHTTNAVYGLALMLFRLFTDHKPSHAAACFDTAAPTYRHETLPAYKAQRPPMDDALYRQIPLCEKLLAYFGVTTLSEDGYEADDLIATVAEQHKQKMPRLLIVSGDMDVLQLVDKTVNVLWPVKGVSEMITYTKEKVVEKYQLRPSQLRDYKAMRGDPSDNILGVPGIGDKTAKQLLQKYRTLENTYENLSRVPPRVRKLLEEGKEEAFLCQKLVTLNTDAPLNHPPSDFLWRGPDGKNLKKLFSELEFRTLAKRISSLPFSQAPGDAEPSHLKAAEPLQLSLL